MNSDEIRTFLKFVVVDDHRTISTTDIEWWAGRLGDIPLQQAIDALIRFRDDHPGKWLEVGHIRQGVRVIRNEQIQRGDVVDQLVPNVDPDRPAEWMTERRAILKTAADGALNIDQYQASGQTLSGVPAVKAIGATGQVVDYASFRKLFPRNSSRERDRERTEIERRALERKRADELAALEAKFGLTNSRSA